MQIRIKVELKGGTVIVGFIRTIEDYDKFISKINPIDIRMLTMTSPLVGSHHEEVPRFTTDVVAINRFASVVSDACIAHQRLNRSASTWSACDVK